VIPGEKIDTIIPSPYFSFKMSPGLLPEITELRGSIGALFLFLKTHEKGHLRQQKGTDNAV
jgi:hypothetical protein